MKVTVAAAQIRVIQDIKVNQYKILDYLDRAKAQKAQIVCFPETALASKTDVVPELSRFIDQISKKCAELKLICVFGSYRKQEQQLKNIVFVISETGEIIFQYDKAHLWNSEKEKVTAGSGNKVIQTSFGPLAIICCWDFAFPGELQTLAKQGAKIFLCPSYLLNFKGDEEFLEKLPVVRAFDTISYFVSCDAFAEDTYSGSTICHPTRTLQSIRGREGLILAEVDLDEIDRLRQKFDHLS